MHSGGTFWKILRQPYCAPLTSEEVTVPISQGGDEFMSQQFREMTVKSVKSTRVWNSLTIMTLRKVDTRPDNKEAAADPRG